MTKILITGATDGIGFEAAKELARLGHDVIIHGRSAEKLERAKSEIGNVAGAYLADLSNLEDVRNLAMQITNDHDKLDVIINNAGIFKTNDPVLENGQDVRFVVNTVAPYVLTQSLLPLMPKSGRVINLASAAQAPVDIDALKGGVHMTDFDAYAQSKYAIMLWSFALSKSYAHAPKIISLNPGSLLATKMVKEGFGMAGNDINIGRDIMINAATGAEFENRGGQYYDNDAQQFVSLEGAQVEADALMEALNALIA